MEDCSVFIDKNSYNAPTEDFGSWSKKRLESIFTFIDNSLATINSPTVIVMEVAHFSTPCSDENYQWASQNIAFANELCGKIIKKYKSKFKIIPTLLVNNLDNNNSSESEKIIDKMVKDQKYITKKSLKIISERNLKNRAFKALKKDSSLSEQFIHIDGKAYLKDDEYKHDLAAGFVNENGDIIPRCGLILTSYLDEITKLAKQRLHQNNDISIFFISFSQQFFEYKRVMLGVDIYAKKHKSLKIYPMIFHWDYSKDRAYLSHKVTSNSWQDQPF